VTHRDALVLLLRFTGAVLVLAFAAMFLPADWMASTHRWLGMGEFPRVAVVEYLARSVAALYGFHGTLVLIVSSDVDRFAPIVRYLGVMNILFGVMMITIDWHAGMPAMWTMVEGPPVVITGGLILYLSARINPVPSGTR
jgi:hypothetical protein